MARYKFIRGNLKRNDYLRVVLTDTAPYEVPIIISNDGFYRNLSAYDMMSPEYKEFVDALIFSGEKRVYTVPFRYQIAKDAFSTRSLSLLHPRAQWQVSKFYERNDTLLTYYCSLGNFSLRRPKYVGSTFFFKSSSEGQNQFKTNRVDISSLEKFVRNPASFFAYDGYDRLYKFFSGNRFHRLESQYKHMTLLDISKCFSSIYTHTIGWAVKGIKHSKENTLNRSFGSEFDRLMQKTNFNETNGICIGPEVSRIFAEVIFNAIDVDIANRCKKINLINNIDYCCFRYVDDYILFTKNPSVTQDVIGAITDSLRVYNLHLNEGKTQHYDRPFLTSKSHMINSLKYKINELFEGITEKKSALVVPKSIRNFDAATKHFVNSIKNECYKEQVGYDAATNYVISSIVKRIEQLCEGHAEAVSKLDIKSDLYGPVLNLLIEVTFFLYTVNPTVPSSFYVGRAIIVIGRFLEENRTLDVISYNERVHKNIRQLIRQHNISTEITRSSMVPVEFLNIMLAASELHKSAHIEQDILTEKVFRPERADYFSLISALYYLSNHSEYDNLRSQIIKQVEKVLGNCERIRNEAHDAHLLLDVLSCPYIPLVTKRSLLTKARKSLGLSALISKTLQDNIIQQMTASPWFTQWNRIDLLNMIKKKELSAVY